MRCIHNNLLIASSHPLLGYVSYNMACGYSFAQPMLCPSKVTARAENTPVATPVDKILGEETVNKILA
jgi:hypothetical protein